MEIRGWAEELAAVPDDPALARHPRAAAVLGTAGEAAYHRGDHAAAERLARLGLAAATDASDRGTAGTVLAVVALARGAYAEAVELRSPRPAAASGWTRRWGSPRSPTAYAGDLDRARELQRTRSRGRGIALDAGVGRLCGR